MQEVRNCRLEGKYQLVYVSSLRILLLNEVWAWVFFLDLHAIRISSPLPFQDLVSVMETH